jgi:hypothetical protein
MKRAAKMNGAAKNGAKKNRPGFIIDLNTPEGVEMFRKAVAAFTKRRLRTREMARQTLIAEGIYTKSGRLSKNYR